MILIVIEKRISCFWTITTGHAVSNTTAQKTPVFLVKKVTDWGVPPFTDKIFSKKGVKDLGGAPPPFTDKIRKVVFEGFP